MITPYTDEQLLKLQDLFLSQILELKTTYAKLPFNLLSLKFHPQFFRQHEQKHLDKGLRADFYEIEATINILRFNKLLTDKYKKQEIKDKVVIIEALINDFISKNKHLVPFKLEVRTYILHCLAEMYLAENLWKKKSFEQKRIIEKGKKEAEREARIIWDKFLKGLNKEKGYIERLSLLRNLILQDNERHIQYIKDLTTLQDERGKDMSGFVRNHFGEMLKKSNGNVSAFLDLVKKSKPLILKGLHQRTKETVKETLILGKSSFDLERKLNHLRHKKHHIHHNDILITNDELDTHKLFRNAERNLVHVLKANTKNIGSEYKVIQFVQALENTLDLQSPSGIDTHQRIRTRYNQTKKELGILTP